MSSKDKTRIAAGEGERILFGSADDFQRGCIRQRRIALCSNRIEVIMSDAYQVNSIIAAAICEARGEHPDKGMDSEEALRLAKCIVEALAGAGLKIVPEDTR
jgi:hypothetical protein